MKHKVKVIGVHDNLIDLRVDGVVMSFLIDRPQPLVRSDAAMLKVAFDDNLMKAVFQGVSPKRSVWTQLADLWHNTVGWRTLPIPAPIHRGLGAPTIWHEIATHIEEVGIEVDLDGVECIVIRKSVLDDMRKGGS